MLLFITCFSGCLLSCHGQTSHKDALIYLEMHLSAMGVESEGFPNADAVIDLRADTGHNYKSYFEPWYTPELHTFTKQELTQIHNLLDTAQIASIKAERDAFHVGITDQPTAVTTFTFASGRTIKLQDYSLASRNPMSAIYMLVFRYEERPIATKKTMQK